MAVPAGKGSKGILSVQRPIEAQVLQALFDLAAGILLPSGYSLGMVSGRAANAVEL